MTADPSVMPRLRVPITVSLLLLALLAVAGCTPVAYYEKARLQDAIMALEDDGTETHTLQKIYYSREGTVGGIGSSAGGGCGCY